MGDATCSALHAHAAKLTDRRKALDGTGVKLVGVVVVVRVVENICQEIFIQSTRRLGEAWAEIPLRAEEYEVKWLFLKATSFAWYRSRDCPNMLFSCKSKAVFDYWYSEPTDKLFS
jgi:hypothetical protein